MMLEVLSLIDRGHAPATELVLDRVLVGEGRAEKGELVRHDGTIWKESRPLALGLGLGIQIAR